MKKLIIFSCLTLFLTQMVWSQEKVEAPVIKIGDKWTFRADNGWEWTTEAIGMEKDLYIFVTVRSEGERKREWKRFYNKNMICTKVISDGKEDKDESRSLSKFFNFPFFPGKKWSYAYTYSPRIGTNIDSLAEISVVGFEDVNVMAGNFRAIKLKNKISVPQWGTSGVIYYWYSQDVKNIIKFEREVSNFWARSEFMRYEMVSYELK